MNFEDNFILKRSPKIPFHLVWADGFAHKNDFHQLYNNCGKKVVQELVSCSQ